MNLYYFVKNNCLGYYDFLGLDIRINAQAGRDSPATLFVAISENKKTEISLVSSSPSFGSSGSTEGTQLYTGEGDVFEPVENEFGYGGPIPSAGSATITVYGEEDGCEFRAEISVSEDRITKVGVWETKDFEDVRRNDDLVALVSDPAIHLRADRFTNNVDQLDLGGGEE